MVIKVKACASQSSGPLGSCTNQGNSGHNANSDYSQLFLGFRVPKGATAPTSFSATTGPTSGGPLLHFRASKSYASELQRLDQAPHKQKWVGYTSRYFLYSSSSGQQNFTAKATFGLPRKANGTVVTGAFHYTVVVGGRQVTSTTVKGDPKEPIDCQSSLFVGWSTLNSDSKTNEDWVCVDDSGSETVTIH